MSLNFDKKNMGQPKISERDRFPEMFQPNRKIDRRQCTRVVPMKVLVLGMCRTGTACTFIPLTIGQEEKLMLDSHVGGP